MQKKREMNYVASVNTYSCTAQAYSIHEQEHSIYTQLTSVKSGLVEFLSSPSIVEMEAGDKLPELLFYWVNAGLLTYNRIINSKAGEIPVGNTAGLVIQHKRAA